MRAHIRNRARSTPINAVPPPRDSSDYSPEMEKAAASLLYRSPIPSKTGHAIYILNAAALPDAKDVDFDALLPYVLARLPGENDLVNGVEYEVILFAGGSGDGAVTVKRNRPGWSWFVQAYHVLSRAMRKRIQKLYIVHERTWVRVLVEMFSTIVSPKFRRKIVHASTLSALALRVPIEDLLIPPNAYLHDRKISPDIFAPYVTGKRAFGAQFPLPRSTDGQSRLPRVLRETTSFILMGSNIRTEGIFRIPPNLRLKEILREAYDRGQKFIIWREGQNILPIPHYEGASDVEAVISELDANDTYGVHLAAGVCKFWYSELRQPLVPVTSYHDLKRLFGDPGKSPNVQELTELLSQKSEWSVLPALSREILTRHLLPMLSKVATQQEYNKMTADNLAVCFGATLLCGPDHLEDAKVSSVVRRILKHAVELWEPHLREACDIAQGAFDRDIQAPTRLEDYEDPLYEADAPKKQQVSPPEYERYEQQRVGIVMKDNEDTDPQIYAGVAFGEDRKPKSSKHEPTQQSAGTGAGSSKPPPLPPRIIDASQTSAGSSSTNPSTQIISPRQSDPTGFTAVSTTDSPLTSFLPSHNSQFAQPILGSGPEETGVKRKPAPPIVVPPRYSTIAASPGDVTESPTTYMAVADGFGPPRPSGFGSEETDFALAESPTSAESPQLKRKPVVS